MRVWFFQLACVRRAALSAGVTLSATFGGGCRDSGLDPTDTRPAVFGAGETGRASALPDSESREIRTVARFIDRAHESGVRLPYQNGEESGNFAIIESLGGGVAVLDYDADGRLDLFYPCGGSLEDNKFVRGAPSALYRQVDRWRFDNVGRLAAIDEARYFSHGAAAADYDNDGFSDVLVTGYGGLVLFHNQGDGTFDTVEKTAGLDDRLWSSSAGWGDINGDGMLDLYVAHYVDWSFDNHPYCNAAVAGQREVCAPKFFQPLPHTLYLSAGDGTFIDGSRQAGLKAGKGLGVLLADVDIDGDLDIYVSNDTEPNFLYLNDGHGVLQETGELSGTALSDKGIPEGSMGVELTDFNRDGLPDLWVTNFERESISLYRNEGKSCFQHVSQVTGLTAVGGLYVGWGTVFFDFDRDGDEDVYVANGHVERFPQNSTVRQTPLLFECRDDRLFKNVAPAAGEYLRAAWRGRGVALADLDEDGDGDLIVAHLDEPPALLANESATDHHWFSLRLIGTRSNRSAIGSRVMLRASGQLQSRQVKGGSSYASTSDLRPRFGLGAAARVDEIEVFWPSGARQTLHDVTADQVITLIEPD